MIICSNVLQVLALKHHTSKIVDFPDLQSLMTFGFRGEALSSLCALGNLTVETRTKNEPVATHLTFDHSGLLTSERKTARQIGTTVTIDNLFSTLPVRSKEFSRNIRKEYGKLISLLNVRDSFPVVAPMYCFLSVCYFAVLSEIKTKQYTPDKKHNNNNKQPYPNYLGSATRILFHHSALFRVLSAVKLQAAMSLFTTSTQVNFGLPLVLLAPSTCIVSLRLTGAVIGLRCTCPNHLNRLSLILSPIGATP